MTKKSQAKPAKQHHLTLHELLGAMSFWGTATRSMLFGFVALMAFIVGLSEQYDGFSPDAEFMLLIYAAGSFLVLDFGYVMVARAFGSHKIPDLLVLLMTEIVLAGLYVIPKLLIAPDLTVAVNPLVYALFISLGVLAGRMLIGLLFASQRR
ncbi:MAG TPA: hypothetical protein VF597_02450 [Candidatus Saccharimonadales bacterium]|jgi:hypothetical protein